MSERMTQAKERLEPEARKLVDGIEQRGDPAEIADTSVLLTLMGALEQASKLERGQQADILRAALTLASASTVYKTLQLLLTEDASRRTLEGLSRVVFAEMRSGVQRLAMLAEMLRDSNAPK